LQEATVLRRHSLAVAALFFRFTLCFKMSSANQNPALPRLNILGTRVASLTYAEAVDCIVERASAYAPGAFVCAANVHCVSMARRNSSYREALNRALLTLPDGMPLVWAHRFLGGRRLKQRVYGPTLMLKLCEAAAKNGLPVYLYGGAHGVAEKLGGILKSGYPGIQIAGSHAPEFGERNPGSPELQREIDAINASGARLLFVALGAPKQEFFMAQHANRIVPVQIGVGAAFNFHTGTVPQAPPWMQGAGLEWLFRFCAEPRRLWKRYLFYNPYFVARIMLQRAGLDRSAALETDNREHDKPP
jgi:N-acetylglucosaminyldiphosphoundecaprenol N-acetyl-beta-D-mannosaminyltransferase